MELDLTVAYYNLQSCINNIPQGTDIDNYIKSCFFIYPSNPEICEIRVEDHSKLINFSDPDTDVHTVSINIFDEASVQCVSDTFTPFGTKNYQLTGEGTHLVEIIVQYTIDYLDDEGETQQHVFEKILMYPVECVTCGDHHNNLISEIKCRVARLNCDILKRRKVGRDYCKMQNAVTELLNYLYLLCNFNLTEKEYDIISCAVTKVKKAC